MDAAERTVWTLEQYQDLEQRTGSKYEYLNGTLRALAGGTLNHAAICGNVFVGLHSALRGSNCRVWNSDAKLEVATANAFFYPDAMVVCGPLQRSARMEAITNPRLLVEVLSSSTARYDLTDKFSHYRSIDSLQGYLVVHQEKMAADLYERKGDLWQIQHCAAEEAELYLSCLDIRLPLKDLYEGVIFKES